MKPIFTSDMNIMKMSQNAHKMYFYTVLVTILCDIKIDLMRSLLPHVKFFFCYPHDMTTVFKLLNMLSMSQNV